MYAGENIKVRINLSS